MDKNKRTAGDILRYVILIAAACIFVFSAVQLIQIFLEYRAGTEEYEGLLKYVQTEPAEDV